jgi:hypothetical protein
MRSSRTSYADDSQRLVLPPALRRLQSIEREEYASRAEEERFRVAWCNTGAVSEKGACLVSRGLGVLQVEICLAATTMASKFHEAHAMQLEFSDSVADLRGIRRNLANKHNTYRRDSFGAAFSRAVRGLLTRGILVAVPAHEAIRAFRREPKQWYQGCYCRRQTRFVRVVQRYL